MAKPLEIALLSDVCGWHCQQLQEVFARRRCRVKRISLSDCVIVTDGGGSVQLPGFVDCLPDGVFVRGIPSGSLEDIVFYLDILHGLKRLGVHVYNDAAMIERSVDKAMTSFLLARAGIATPPTWTVANYQRARALVMQLTAANRAVVLKPMFGSQGRGLQLIRDVAELPQPPDDQPQVYYLQQFVESDEVGDWRVFVVGDQVVSAMQRHGRSWVHNAAQGAECRYIEADAEMASLAIAASRAVGLFYAGVDLMRDAHHRLQVIEVNSIPAWKSLQSVSCAQIAEYLVDYFMATRYCRVG